MRYLNRFFVAPVLCNTSSNTKKVPNLVLPGAEGLKFKELQRNFSSFFKLAISYLKKCEQERYDKSYDRLFDGVDLPTNNQVQGNNDSGDDSDDFM